MGNNKSKSKKTIKINLDETKNTQIIYEYNQILIQEIETINQYKRSINDLKKKEIHPNDLNQINKYIIILSHLKTKLRTSHLCLKRELKKYEDLVSKNGKNGKNWIY